MGKLIVITGVGRGLGRVMAEELIKAGHTVLGCTRSSESIAQLNQAYPTPHEFTPVDVADEAQVQHWAEEMLRDFRPPDLLINNAGLVNHPAPLWKVSAEEFDRVVDVNIKGVANVIRHFVPAMVAERQGVIVNFSSGWGRSTSANVAPYCATKWAIEGLTRALAQDLPEGMAAVALNPGIIHTDMLEICYGEEASSFTTVSAWGEKAVPFLLQLQAKDNGQPLTVPV